MSIITLITCNSVFNSYHHEHLDGKGYPFHIKGKKIKLGARILAVADIFTALAEKRPYRAPMIKEDVINIMAFKGDDKELDSKVVKILLENYDLIDTKRKKSQDMAKQEYKSFWKNIKKERLILCKNNINLSFLIKGKYYIKTRFNTCIS
jgi:HD-GYP domain-containing protein (c-di-GMP phosphodiesterase class II)